ncbi:MAG: hypothetical protein HKN09_13780 [Saprospiraceae bacterium]|nr:hypothetical protein [Saprospiraceae bacterium]
MRTLFSCIIFIVCAIAGHTQSTIIDVLGRHEYTQQADMIVFEIDTSNKRNTAEKLDSLFGYLNHNAIPFESIDQTHDKIEIGIEQLNATEDIQRYLAASNMRYNSTYYFKDKPLESQDDMAILALEDAKRRASVMTKKLGKKIKGIKSIDDVVEKYLFYPELDVNSECKKQVANLLLQYLEDRRTLVEQRKSKNPIRSSIYAIWVSFEVQ